ncbi:DUF4253 domain-containing protein [Nakamurella endophytica]|uniref:DUF4253 domain-containing protein n=1 Tax=Nakamurella endophytica TaxID=1748367 RepID=A0A917T4X5_9ACTN|nr:DUF4253 domain-containing protein [Nakamurella endophytica]GGM10248.1 hypothetical protein GCM10011594_32720 [Nakamurella endophytica]
MVSAERLRFDRRVAASGGLPEPEDETWLDRETLWLEPTGQPCALLLLPTDKTWRAAAQASYFGVHGWDAAPESTRESAFIATVHQWSDRYGAELVASWGTTLQFVATHPPAPTKPSNSQDNCSPSAAASRYRNATLATALMHTHFWFLHDRPLPPGNHGLPPP